jgi:hypothetical protein
MRFCRLDGPSLLYGTSLGYARAVRATVRRRFDSSLIRY